MLTSRPIEVGGELVGIALSRGDGWAFRPVHPATGPLRDLRFNSRAEVERCARLALAGTCRPPGPSTPS